MLWVYIAGVVLCFMHWTIGQYPNEAKREAVTVSPFWPLLVAWLIIFLPKAIYEDIKNLDI